MKRGITARQLIKARQQDGFLNTRTRGSHHFYEHPDGRATTVSYHKRSDTFPIGTLKGMIEDVEWTDDDFRRYKFRVFRRICG